MRVSPCPEECKGCMFQVDYADDDLGVNMFCAHPQLARRSMQCPTRLTAAAQRKYGRWTKGGCE